MTRASRKARVTALEKRQAPATAQVRHKFGAVRTAYQGRNYASKAEAEYAAHLDLLQASGELLMYLEQVPFHLGAGKRYVCDFLCFWADGRVDTRDVKGMETAEFKLKWALVQERYPLMAFIKIKRQGKNWSEE